MPAAREGTGLQLRPMTVVAQDPAVRLDGKVVMGVVWVPSEGLEPGPKGHRVHVVDYDASTDRWRRPRAAPGDRDPWAKAAEGSAADVDRILANPHFHAWNAYAVVMATLRRFEFALGRRIGWSFDGHQIKVAPHAFADANAFYSRRDESLLFGYFQAPEETVYTCLAHDVVAHETSHGLLDGLRRRYMDASSWDQAAFHEGFADVVALLSVFAMEGVVGKLLDLSAPPGTTEPGRIDPSVLTAEKLRAGLLALGRQLGGALSAVRGRALRTSAEIPPSPDLYRTSEEFREPHRRGEILVAAVLNAFLEVWLARIATLGEVRGAGGGTGRVDRARVVEDGAAVADTLLDTAIRAIDYTPPVDLRFGDYLAALLTADRELRPDDSTWNLREHLLASFRAYGITRAAAAQTDWTWPRDAHDLRYDGVHLESLQRDPDEVFRFLWDNRAALGLDDGTFARVLSVRPCVRVDAEDGFVLRETVAEYMQMRTLRADELRAVGVRAPQGIAADAEVTLYGGGTLLFDEFGRLKYHVPKPFDGESLTEQVRHRWEAGEWTESRSGARRFAALHRLRVTGTRFDEREEW